MNEAIIRRKLYLKKNAKHIRQVAQAYRQRKREKIRVWERRFREKNRELIRTRTEYIRNVINNVTRKNPRVPTNVQSKELKQKNQPI